jgi:hypothetical protein
VIRHPALVAALVLAMACVAAGAQTPHVNTLFPIGGRAGTTVDVEIRGSGLEGAKALLIRGAGATGTVDAGGGKVDETSKPLWQNRCGGCHELRSPANRSMTPAQWAATVERMVKAHQAPLSDSEAAKVTEYLVSAAKAGRLTAQIKVAADVLPGLIGVRVVTDRGVSTEGAFEIGSLPEVFGAAGTREQAQKIDLPCTANGTILNSGERHFFRFAAKQGQRLVFDLKAFRYNEAIQMFFNPDLRLYDSGGVRIAENHGYYELDPLVDWSCPKDGDYTIEVRDLLGRGNPGNVYRLRMGPLPYDTCLFPAAATAGSTAPEQVVGRRMEGTQPGFSLHAPAQEGPTIVGSPFGPQQIYVTPYAVITHTLPAGARSQPASATETGHVVQASAPAPSAATLPACFSGLFHGAGTTQLFPIRGSGMFEMEGFATRLGQDASLHADVIDAKGNVLARFDNDGRAPLRLAAGGDYTLRVEDHAPDMSADHVYAVEIRPLRPRVRCIVRPDNVTVRPGSTTLVEAFLTEREGNSKDVEISAEHLPAGVTATPVRIPGDRSSGLLLLSARPDAAPAAAHIRILAKAEGESGQAGALAVAQEEYRLYNVQRFLDRAECALAVGGKPAFNVAVTPSGPIAVHPRNGVEMKVHVTRQPGFNGGIRITVVGLPSGWVANETGIGPGQQDATLLVRPDGNDPHPFLKRAPTLTPVIAAVLADSDGFPVVAAAFQVQPYKLWEQEEKNSR